MGDTDVLRELHDAYAWQINAAVGEDRMDLVWRLADEYTDRALQLIAAAVPPPGCVRADCVICARSSSAQTGPARRSWLGWSRRHHAA
jgi:hypothetical protein